MVSCRAKNWLAVYFVRRFAVPELNDVVGCNPIDTADCFDGVIRRVRGDNCLGHAQQRLGLCEIYEGLFSRFVVEHRVNFDFFV